MIGGNLGAVQGSDGCWTMGYWCGVDFISQLFDACKLPTPEQLNDPRCNAGKNLDTSMTNQLFPRSSYDMAASADPTGAKNYLAALNHPTLTAMFGPDANLPDFSIPWGSIALIGLGVVGVLVITR